MTPVTFKRERPRAVSLGRITARGRTYEVFHDAAAIRSPHATPFYVLTAHAVYALFRNLNDPAMLFPVREGAGLAADERVPPGVWFRERNGRVESAS